MQTKTNNKFYLLSYLKGIANEKKFCDLFNHKFSDYGFSIIHKNNKIFALLDAEIFYKNKFILKVEIKTRADNFFNNNNLKFDTILLNKSKVDNTNTPETLFIFDDNNFKNINFYFNIKRSQYLKYKIVNQGRADRTEKKLCYKIPIEHCFNSWNHLLKFLKLLADNKINKDFSAESIFDLLKFAPPDFFEKIQYNGLAVLIWGSKEYVKRF